MRILLSCLALGVVCACMCVFCGGMKLPKTSQGLVGILIGPTYIFKSRCPEEKFHLSSN